MSPRGEPCPLHPDQFVHPMTVVSETMDHLYICRRLEGHGLPGTYSWSWLATAPATELPGLDLDETLLGAVEAASSEHGGGWVEYGLVERAYALAHPEDWQRLLDTYSHRRYLPAGASRGEEPYTASRRLGAALGAARRRQALHFRQGPGTGYWAYNRVISYYAPLSVEGPVGTRTWADSGHDVDEHVPVRHAAA